ncbi:MAG: cytochrome c biogenesis CcdA family protein [Thermoplasmata archaeon]
MADPVLLGFAYGAGVISFFSPCAFPMLPAYISYYLGQDDHARNAGPEQGLLFGGLTLLGMLTVFGALGGLLSFIGSRFLGQAIPLFGLSMGVLLVAVGVLLLATHRLRFSLPIRAPRFGGRVSFYLYGVAYALVSLGCTFPIFLVVVTGALLTQGFLEGIFVFLVYSLGMGTVMIFLSLAVSTSREYLAASMGKVVPYVRLISAAVLIGVGAYMAYFYYNLYYA